MSTVDLVRCRIRCRVVPVLASREVLMILCFVDFQFYASIEIKLLYIQPVHRGEAAFRSKIV